MEGSARSLPRPTRRVTAALSSGVATGTLERVLHALAEDLYQRGGIDLSEALIDGTFAGAKKGRCVGKTRRGKGTKIMAIADGAGLPIAVASASPHEVTLVEQTIDGRFLERTPERLIGDRAYDSNRLDARLREERDIEPIARHPATRKKTQDRRPLRRYRRRWKIERLFAWLHNFRRLITRHTPRTSSASSSSAASASC